MFSPSTEAGIDHSWMQDVYVVLTGVTGDRAQMRIAFNPLVMWVWIGGAMIALGGAVAKWPSSIDGMSSDISQAVSARSDTAEVTV